MTTKPSLVVLLLAATLVPGWLVASAQTATPGPSDSGQTAVIEVEGWIYEVDTAQPLVLFAERITETNEARYVGALVFWRQPDGTYRRLTACDDRAVPCGPLATEGTAALAGVGRGDALVLGDEVVN